ncbi:hypothetical protein KB879_33715 (plasmid) [Cupriavidus sp. KK10]|uniref:YciI family protein n=1 Tax=Cupriavidus sp. KK10 TaxID=1478019 RepID=UPI001BABC94D|nr:YciI family protein [Cupriavidus sp. KK10]QUN32574.1 hypothetical protein KB879_33715 [Cupriavidus sp. KK10]
MDNIVSQDLSRRRFLVSAAAGVAGLALADMRSAVAASSLSHHAAEQGAAPTLPTLSEVLSGDPGAMKIVNYAKYVHDQDRVNASRAEHVAYADALREHDRLVMGGPLLDDDGRAGGVLLVYQVASEQEAETLAQRDPFVLQGAIADYRLAEWAVLSRNVDVKTLAASLVTADRQAQPKELRASGATSVAPDARPARLYVNYAKYVSDHSRIERVRPAHRSYARAIRAKGALMIGGPFADDSGALLIYRAQSKDEAMALVLEDPYHAEGVYETYALSEWRLFGLNAGLIEKR